MVRKSVLLLAAVIAVNSALLLLLRGTWQPCADDRRAAQQSPVLQECLDDVVTVQNGGRFGNVFMEYASALGVARRLNLTVALPELIARSMKEAFDGVAEPTVAEFLRGRNASDGAPCGSVLREEDVLQTPLRWNSDANEPVFRGSGPIVLRKWTVQSKYIFESMPYLRAKLRFVPRLLASAQAHLRSAGDEVAAVAGARREEVVFIGVHVRRTDYHEWLIGYKFNKVAEPSYYVRAVAWLRASLEAKRGQEGAQSPLPVAVVVTSDDLPWVRTVLVPALQSAVDNGKMNSTWIYIGGSTGSDSALKDLALLSACNHTVMSYGTFGITAALLAGGLAVAYRVDIPHYFTTVFAELIPGWTLMR